jgi:hypothetical protein
MALLVFYDEVVAYKFDQPPLLRLCGYCLIPQELQATVVSSHYEPVAQEIGAPFLDCGDQREYLLFVSGQDQVTRMEGLAEVCNGMSALHQNGPNAEAGSVTLNYELLGEIW